MSTIIGLFLGIVAIGLGMYLKGANPSTLNNPAALLIIFGGTAASLFIAFPMAEIKKLPVLLKIAFREPKLVTRRQLVETFVDWATIARREGLLGLEENAGSISDPFLKNGLLMIIDGNDGDFIADVLEEEITAMEERHRANALIFSQAGTYAPTLGVLGAVVGLIAALGNLKDIDKLGHSIAAAFVATLLGIFSGYVLWHPISNKLRRNSRREAELKLMMVEGLLSIQGGISPKAMELKLNVYLPPSERKGLTNEERDPL